MKNHHSWQLILLICLLSFATACNNNSNEEVVTPQVAVEAATDGEDANKRFINCIEKPIFIGTFLYNHRPNPFRQNDCTFSPRDFCFNGYIDVIYFCFPIEWEWIFPICPGPKCPIEIPRFDIDDYRDFGPLVSYFSFEKDRLGLQFYEQGEFIIEKGFTLKDDLILDVEIAQELGLQGNVVEAGVYPLEFNKEGEVFNASLPVLEGFKQF